MPRRPTLAAFALAAALIAAACGGGDDAADPTVAGTAATDTAAPPTQPVDSTSPDTAPADTAAPATDASYQPVVFEKVVPGGGCLCADGGEYAFWVREADPSKVLFFFQGGGACFSKETCGPGGPFKRSVSPGEDPALLDTGIWDEASPDNPFADWSVVYVPYCTGDVHIGNNVMDYGDGVVINHKGYLNSMAALEELAERFPDATEVFVTGESAGGVPVPLFTALVGDLLPAASLAGLADSSGAYPSDPALNAGIGALWGTSNARPDWAGVDVIPPEEWSIPGGFVVATEHNPAVRLARFDYATDGVQSQFTGLVGLDSSQLLQLIRGNEAGIEAEGVSVSSWIAEGSSHTVLGSPQFATLTTAGQRFADWFNDFVAGEPVDDVACETCR